MRARALRADPHQQGVARRSRGESLAHRRMAGEIRAGAQRHRAHWLDLKRHHLAHQTFRDVDALDTAIHRAAAARNAERALVSQFAPVLQNAALAFNAD